MSAAGISKIIEYLKKEKFIQPIFPISICAHGEEFSEALEQFVKTPEINESCILFQHWHYPGVDPDPHVTPLYLKRSQAGAVEIFITDSIGSMGKPQFASFIIETIQAYLPNSTVYWLTPQRQHDVVTCSTFSIIDTLTMTKNSEEFVTLARQSAIPTENSNLKTFSGKCYDFNVLPLNSLLPTQSISQIENDLRVTKRENQRFGKKLQTVNERLKSYKISVANSQGKVVEQNAYAAYKAAKYFSILTRIAIEEEFAQQNISKEC
jgi:hypothetical protein